MATRPAPRSSRLATLHPVSAPPRAAAPEVAPESSPQPAPEVAPEVNTEQPAPSEKTERRHRHKVSFYQAEADTERVRGVLLNTMAYESYRTMTDFIAAAVMEKAERMEEKYNGGKPFPSIKPGGIPQGRPHRD